MHIRLLMPDGVSLPLTPQAEVHGLAVTHTAENSVHTVTLTATRTGIFPEALEVSFPLPADLLTPIDDLLVYDNAAHTNDVSGVSSYASFREKGHEFAELAVFKNLANGKTLLCGLCTAHRFWSAFFVKDGTVTGGMPESRGNAFTDRERLIKALKNAAKPGDVILFKGSHGMHLELVLEAFLEEKK